MEVINEKNVLITGGTGFIGNYLVNSLKKKANLSVLTVSKEIKDVKNIKVNLRDRNGVIKAARDIDIIFHMGGEVPTPGIRDLPQKNFEVNTIGTLNILEAGRINDVQQIIFSSTMSVFGDPKYLPMDEKHKKNPNTFYGLSKLSAEECCRLYKQLYDVKITILRYSSVYGVGQNPDWVIPTFIKNGLTEKTITIFGRGENSGDFVHVKDVVRANILSVVNKKAYGEDFNIGSGKETSINELADIIRELVNLKIKIKHNHMNEGKTKRFVFDISKARTLIDYNPRYTIDDSLKEMIDNIGDRYE